MMDWNTLAIVFQMACTLWFALTHWIPLPPLNDLSAEAFPNERRINILLHAFQLGSIAGFYFQLWWLMWIGVAFWTLSLIGHIFSWWLPYFWGWPKAFLKNAESDNAKTYHFLPKRKNHPIPDLNHCVIGLLIVAATFASWRAMF
jgi:hypothetical protein